MTGGCGSVTVTVKMLVALLPLPSVAEQATGVTPTGKREPLVGMHLTGRGALQLSVAVGGSQVPTAAQSSEIVLFVRPGEPPVMRGVCAFSTMIAKLWVALNGGLPSSVTAMHTRFDAEQPSAGVVQVKRPLVVSRSAPGGPDTSENTRRFGGLSASVAELVTVKVMPAATVRSGTGASSGAWFTSVTITVKVCVALKGGLPLSVTTMTNWLVPGPSASPGVQVKSPLVGLSKAPLVGARPKLKVSASLGKSASVATFVTISVCPSATV